jgi:hypothetical protein
MRNLLLFILLVTVIISKAQTKILFDATKAETAGSADWVIDADLNNLDWTTTSTVKTGGSKANAQQLPTPAQSTVKSSTVETYWTGALSSWGIDCVNKGYHVESLPYNGRITYGDNTNAQDLSNYKVYIVDEPNIYFTAAEKTAILNFVKNGGGLFMISDHAGSDRNNDGSDSPTIWNDLMTNNDSVTNPFGISYVATAPNSNTYPSDFSETATNFLTTKNPISQGSYGTATKLKYSDGTSLDLDTVANPTIKGVVFATESTSIINGAMFAYAKYGKGKIVATGDSSPCDDGTGSSGYTGLYVSYANDPTVGDNHRYLYMNSTIWLATTDTALPIKFVSINGANKNNLTTINWQASETGSNDSYQIEKSTDGNSFNTVANIAKKNIGNNQIENYQWQTQETINKKEYYRIKAMDNLNDTYSDVVEIAPTNKEQISIYPNPSSSSNGNGFTISGLNPGSIVTISDMKGKLFFQTTSSGASISNSNSRIPKMASGVYIVTIKDADVVSTQKLIIGR